MGKKKFYVVWHGVEPGVYHSWPDCLRQVKGFPGAVYKSFGSEAEAFEAYTSSPADYVARTAVHRASANVQHSTAPANPPAERHDTVLPLPAEVTANALAVDAACSGNPGPMEYRGVNLATGQQEFHYGPVYGTNNIGEFLAIVHALALLKRDGRSMTVYTDSRNALLWVKARKCRTRLERTPRTARLFELIERAEKWLSTNDYSQIPLLKWQTEKWGEVPADFGRK